MNIPGKILSALTGKQKKKVEAAQSPEELLSLAKESGYELSQEQLSQVSGGKHLCPPLHKKKCKDKEVPDSGW